MFGRRGKGEHKSFESFESNATEEEDEKDEDEQVRMCFRLFLFENALDTPRHREIYRPKEREREREGRQKEGAFERLTSCSDFGLNSADARQCIYGCNVRKTSDASASTIAKVDEKTKSLFNI
jgi:hypothetical protein